MLATTMPTLSVPPPFSVYPVPTQTPSDANPPIVLQDDPPYPSHVKTGPLGQIIRVSSGGAAKKKARGKDSGTPAAYVPVAVALTGPTVSSGFNLSEVPQKIKTGAAGEAAGTGGTTKTGKAVGGLPPVVVASA